MLIVDQFEELFTRHPERWQDGLGFFQQLRQALDTTPGLSVVLAMREDHLAGLDPYLSLLPSQLQARFRLEALDHQQAHEAIEKPARLAGYEFEKGAVQRLVTDLSRIKIQRYGPQGIEEVRTGGRYIEPVQLQVVCSQLWSSLDEAPDRLIPWQEVRKHGNVNQALTGFYTQSLQQAARATGVKERDLRRWFSERLITPVHTRGLALQGGQDTAGLPNAAVRILEQAHLIRADLRAGARWYELSHDRLVEPIMQSNRAWEATRQTPLRITAQQWQRAKNSGLLYREHILKEALVWARAHPDEVETYEQEFLDASLQAEQSRIRRRRWYTGGVAIAILVVAIMAILTFLAVRGQQAAQTAEAAAEARRQEAVAQTHISEYRRLAAQAVANQDRVPDLALLLGVEANRMEDNGETRNALLNVLQSKPQLTAYLRGHTGIVNSVAFSPDSKTLASSGSDNTIILWNMTTRQLIGEPLKGHTDSVYSVAFSPDGKILASGSKDNTIRLWDVATCQPVGDPLKMLSVTEIAFSPDGKILTSLSVDSTIILWDVITHQPIGEPLKNDDPQTIRLSPDGKILASGRIGSMIDKSIILWDVTTRQPVGEPFGADASEKGYYNGVSSLAFSPNGKILASGNFSEPIDITLWDVTTHKPAGEPLKGHTNLVNSLAFSPNGKILASGSADKTIILWDVTTRQPAGEPLKGHTNAVTSIAFSPDGKWLASAGNEDTILLWDTHPDQLLAGHIAAISPDGKTLASINFDQTLLWDVTTRQPISEPLNRNPNYGRSVAFSPDGRWLASEGSTYKIIQMWDVTTHQPVGKPLEGHTALVNSFAFSPDGTILASGSNDKTIRLWDVATRQPVGEPLKGHIDSVTSVVFNPDGKILASGSAEKTIRLWDMATRQPAGEPLTGHTDSVNSVAFSPDGKILASGSEDKMIILWDLTTRQPVGEPLKGHTDSVNSVAFSMDGKMLASGSLDKTVQLWDVTTRQPIGQPFKGHVNPVDTLIFTLDGKSLISSSVDGAFFWHVSPIAWRTRACQIANRNLTQAEWVQYFNPDPASYAAEYVLHPTCPGLP